MPRPPPCCGRDISVIAMEHNRHFKSTFLRTAFGWACTCWMEFGKDNRWARCLATDWSARYTKADSTNTLTFCAAWRRWQQQILLEMEPANRWLRPMWSTVWRCCASSIAIHSSGRRRDCLLQDYLRQDRPATRWAQQSLAWMMLLMPSLILAWRKVCTSCCVEILSARERRWTQSPVEI